MSSFSPSLENSLRQALTFASDRGHEVATLEHLLLSLLDDADAVSVVEACGASVEGLRQKLVRYLDEEFTPLVGKTSSECSPSTAFHRVVRRAIIHVHGARKEQVTGANVLIALFGERESRAVWILEAEGATRLDAVNFMAHGITKTSSRGDGETLVDDDSSGEESSEGEEGGKKSSSPLEEWCRDLNEKARRDEIDPLIGRDSELDRMVAVLARRRKNNPLLVGEPGVGKTAVAEGLASRLVSGSAPEMFSESTVYQLDLGSLIAGTRYRGDFEERVKEVLEALSSRPGAILFIDEIHMLIGAGATSGGAMDASNLLKPALAEGKLRCIGSTTYKEYADRFEKDRALARRFQKIDVPEPSSDEAFKILVGLKRRFEDFHGVRYTMPSLKSAVKLSTRHIVDRRLPDKAIDMVDEAGAQQRIAPSSRRKKSIGVKEIEEAVAKAARIPPKSVSRSERDRLSDLEVDLRRMVFGQDAALAALSDAVKVARAGLREPDRPVGCYLFPGPTGVGKTETAKQLAASLGVELVRFDMSEYMERHSVSRLIGAPPGYVGFDQGGLLTDAVYKTPHCVLLLDEIEKAHPDLFNLLLQVMDRGALTDHNGRAVDFRNVILIMTTNAGAARLASEPIGFTKPRGGSEDNETVKILFPPEFRNRLDAIVSFSPLDMESIRRVARKFVTQLEAQLFERGVVLDLDEDAAQWLAEKGYDPIFGARPLSRLIGERIKKPLAEATLFGSLRKGGTARIVLGKDDNGDVAPQLKIIEESEKESPVEESEGASPVEEASPRGRPPRPSAKRGGGGSRSSGRKSKSSESPKSPETAESVE